MSKYFDNLGIAVDGIKLNVDGVWMLPRIEKDKQGQISKREIIIAEDRKGEKLLPIHAATPVMGSASPDESQVATVEWVVWALKGDNISSVDLTKYNNNIILTNTLKTTVDGLNSKVSTLEQTVNTINTNISSMQVSELQRLLTDTVILWGGNAAGWEDDV